MEIVRPIVQECFIPAQYTSSPEIVTFRSGGTYQVGRRLPNIIRGFFRYGAFRQGKGSQPAEWLQLRNRGLYLHVPEAPHHRQLY